MRPRRVAHDCGFTLIEVMVALAIVTLGMAALLGTLSSAAGTTGYLQDKTLAEWIALNQVATVRLQSAGPSKGNSEGEIDYAGRKWKWSQTVDDMQIPGVLRIDVKVRPSDVTASQDKAWYADVSGVFGNAVGQPRGDLPTWTTIPDNPPQGTQPTPQNPAATPGATPTSPFNPAPPTTVPQVNPPVPPTHQ